jgi:hypothetical protein
MKRGGANEQIFKWNDDSARRTVALNASCQPCDLGSQRIGRDIPDQFIHEQLSALALGFGSRTRNAVGELYQRDPWKTQSPRLFRSAFGVPAGKPERQKPGAPRQ